MTTSSETGTSAETSTARALQENRILQVCFVTDSLERTSGFLSDLFDRQPDRLADSAAPEQARTRYRGEPSRATCRMAFWRFDNIEVELIEPDAEPSAWRDYLDQHGPSLHHIAFQAFGMKATTDRLAAKGIGLAMSGEFTGGRYAYLDTERQLGALVELLEFDR